jgi:hypothetical protein
MIGRCHGLHLLYLHFFSEYTLAVTNAARNSKQPPIWFPTFFLVVFQVTLGHCLKNEVCFTSRLSVKNACHPDVAALLFFNESE